MENPWSKTNVTNRRGWVFGKGITGENNCTTWQLFYITVKYSSVSIKFFKWLDWIKAFVTFFIIVLRFHHCHRRSPSLMRMTRLPQLALKLCVFASDRCHRRIKSRELQSHWQMEQKKPLAQLPHQPAAASYDSFSWLFFWSFRAAITCKSPSMKSTPCLNHVLHLSLSPLSVSHWSALILHRFMTTMWQILKVRGVWQSSLLYIKPLLRSCCPVCAYSQEEHWTAAE